MNQPGQTPAKSRRDAVRFTVDQVLRGLQAWVDDNWSGDTQLDPDRSLLDYRDEAQRQDECPLLTLQGIAEHFGLDWGESRWIVWLNLRDDGLQTAREREAAWERWVVESAPRLTVRRLAEAIAKRAEGISFDPVAILGRRCGPAGAFYGLCNLPELRGRRVGPSTPLRAALDWRQLRAAWRRTQWIAGCELPALRSPDAVGETTVTQLADVAATATMATIVIAAMCAASAAGLWLAAIAGVVGAATAVELRRRFLYWLIDPWPAELQTFGDLARRIAHNRQR